MNVNRYSRTCNNSTQFCLEEPSSKRPLKRTHGYPCHICSHLVSHIRDKGEQHLSCLYMCECTTLYSSSQFMRLYLYYRYINILYGFPKSNPNRWLNFHHFETFIRREGQTLLVVVVVAVVRLFSITFGYIHLLPLYSFSHKNGFQSSILKYVSFKFAVFLFLFLFSFF